MLHDGKSLTKSTQLETDICILGCGVAGMVIANELKDKHQSLTIIEAGSETYDPEVQDIYTPNSKHSIFTDPSYSRLRMLGGSSNHWENNTSPFDAIDFEKRDWVKNSGWPISFDVISPFYQKAAWYCGAGEMGYNVDHWEKQLNHKPVTHTSNRIDTAISIFSSPPVRFFERYGESLTNSENIQIYKNCNVVSLDYDSSSKKIESAIFETVPGIQHTIKAKTFIMCFGGIENARMLLHFNQRHDNKLGNEFDNVGRYFMDHPVVEAAHFFPHDLNIYQIYQDNHIKDRFVTAYLKLNDSTIRKHKLNNLRMPLIPRSNYYMSDGVSSFHILKNAAGNGELPNHFGTHILNLIKDIDMVAEGISRKQFDNKLFDDAGDIEGFMIYMMMEQTPDRNNRVKLSQNKDPFGIPRIDIDWKLSNKDKENLWRALEILAQDIGELSLGRVKILKERATRIWEEQTGFGNHHMGTTRMSNTPKDGVVDKNQKVFGTENFYIAGSSVFPTGGHVPPTLTIAATSIRLAEHIAKLGD